MHSTLCRAHATDNRNAHRFYKASIDWANSIRTQTTGQSTGSMSFLMTVDEEVESSSEKELVEMNSMRKEIHIKTCLDIIDLLGQTNTDDQTTLIVVEDPSKIVQNSYRLMKSNVNWFLNGKSCG